MGVKFAALQPWLIFFRVNAAAGFVLQKLNIEFQTKAILLENASILRLYV
jgi:hypothetical protein